MGSIRVTSLGKAYKQYPTRWSRLVEWALPFLGPKHQLKWVLREMDFIIEPGEAVGIVGVNGAGKSTLLKMITGTTQPTTGRVETSGRVAALLELGMGFHPDFTGRQNCFMAGQLLGLSADEVHRLMPEIEAFAEIGDYIEQPVRVYSSGMQVRLAFSAATAVRPDILIVDEALAVGDAYFQAKCYERINRYKQEGMTLLLVSHSVGEIVKHCNRALFIHNGHLSHDGDSRDVTNLYLDALFGGQLTGGAGQPVPLPSEGHVMIPGGEDLFHTRPGYRKEEHRWGQGGAIILDYLVITQDENYPHVLESNSCADFYFKVRFDRDFDSVIPGFLIKTIDGIFLYGTNSFVSSPRHGTISASAGEIMVFRFSLPVALNEGHYLISFGISSGDPLHQLVPLERRYDSVLVNVVRPLQFWGIADLGATFEIAERIQHG